MASNHDDERAAHAEAVEVAEEVYWEEAEEQRHGDSVVEFCWLFARISCIDVIVIPVAPDFRM